MLIAICDDEQIYIDRIEQYLSKHKNFANFESKEFLCGEDLILSYKNRERFDIIFLDIKMTGLNGLEIAKEIRKIDKEVIIIFITNLVEFVFQGYKVHAFQYLLKPVVEEEFSREFLRAVQEITSRKDKKYVIKTKEEITALDVSNIVFLESCGRRIVLHTKERIYEYYANISQEEMKLNIYEFVRIHKSYLVNMEYIKTINKSDIQLKNSERVPLSEKRRKVVFDIYSEYLMGKSI